MNNLLNFITTMAVVHKSYKYHGVTILTNKATVKIWLL